jgi:sulfide:quinone oxidoreductase
MTSITVLGGGFGGLAGAHELRRLLPDADITVVDRGDRFFMGFAKLWDLAGIRPLEQSARALAGLSKYGIAFEQREIDEVALGHADALLVALGAGASPAHTTLLQDGGGHNLYDAAALPAMRGALETIESGRVVVSILGPPFKCPPAPFEAVLLVDERLRQRGVRDRVEVAITTPQPITLPVAGPDASAYVAAFLAERDIQLLAKHSIVSIDPGALQFDGGTSLAFDLLLGVPASAPPPIVKNSDLAGPNGWIEPDRHTLRTSQDRVYAVGDCTMIPTATAQLPKAGVFAAAEGEVAARNIAADLGVGEPASFDGHGFCFLELPGQRVAFVEGNFYAEPQPDVTLTEADAAQYERKLAYERDRLDAWL